MNETYRLSDPVGAVVDEETTPVDVRRLWPDFISVSASRCKADEFADVEEDA
jgi:hypothetical protein